MASTFLKFLRCSLILATCTVQAQTSDAAASDTPQAVTIVELFTSEGCSSCPPADELLRRVNLTRARSGQLIVGLSEHVTYWNRLGWQDPFSQEVFTERQNAYASRFSLEGPYTPQMVVNGEKQLIGSDAAALARAVESESLRRQFRLKILAAATSQDGVDLRFIMDPQRGEPVAVYAAVTDDLDRTDVLRGENSGLSLQNASVVRSFVQVSIGKDGDEQVAHIPLPKNFDRSSKTGHHVVIFAQLPHEGAIVGAAISQLF